MVASWLARWRSTWISTGSVTCAVRKGSSSRWLSRFALGFEAAPQPTHRAGRIVPVMLRLAGVRKTYGKTVAVDALDLEIRRGEVFGLLGPNGAGKSTTVGLAVGL